MDVVLHVRQSGNAMQTYTAQALAELLELSPHPEGGYFRETFRSSERIQRSAATLALLDRAAGTAIYYLLPAGTFSAWHSVRSDEIWHHYDGAPAELHLIDLTGPEFQKQPFTRSWIYGIYDGKVIFYETMITRAYLMSKPNGCLPIKAAKAVGVAGFYPTEYCVRHDAKTGEYSVSMEKFIHRQASAPEAVAAKG